MASIQTDIKSWLEENENFFQPPTCVKHLHESQLKVFFVGGPNKRKDFHIEAGEEFFFMLKGDMCLTVLEKEVFRDIIIKEGEVFLLPARIPHSPQRKPNTIGMVIERRRTDNELDCLRYFVDNSKEVLYETWFNWEKNSSKLGEYIEEFFNSEQFKTGNPKSGSILQTSPLQVDHSKALGSPIKLDSFINASKNILDQDSGTELNLYGETYKTKIQLLGNGEHHGCSEDLETYLLQMDGYCEVKDEKSEFRLEVLHSLLVPAGESWSITNAKGGITLKVIQNQ